MRMIAICLVAMSLAVVWAAETAEARDRGRLAQSDTAEEPGAKRQSHQYNVPPKLRDRGYSLLRPGQRPIPLEGETISSNTDLYGMQVAVVDREGNLLSSDRLWGKNGLDALLPAPLHVWIFTDFMQATGNDYDDELWHSGGVWSSGAGVGWLHRSWLTSLEYASGALTRRDWEEGVDSTLKITQWRLALGRSFWALPALHSLFRVVPMLGLAHINSEIKLEDWGDKIKDASAGLAPLAELRAIIPVQSFDLGLRAQVSQQRVRYEEVGFDHAVLWQSFGLIIGGRF